MSRSVALVGCGAAKQDVVGPVPARELYTSHYFQLKRRYAEAVCDDWRILSARHGLLHPTEPVRPYDVSINDLDVFDRYSWAHDVYDDLLELDDVDEHVVLAGQAYINPLEDAFADLTAGRSFTYPFEGTTGIGEQIAWLKEQLYGVDETPDDQAGLARWSA